MRRILVFSTAPWILTGCATTSQTQWTPTVDTYGSSRAQFLTRDTEECRALAMRVSGSTTEQAAQAAVSRPHRRSKRRSGWCRRQQGQLARGTQGRGDRWRSGCPLWGIRHGRPN
jgi:hypothetical protein